MLPRSPPVPIAATFNLTTLLLDVTFDRLLTAGPSAGVNWTADAAFFKYGTIFPANALGTHVTATLVKGPNTPDPDTVTYAAAPPDLLSKFGIPAPPFVDYPLVVVP